MPVVHRVANGDGKEIKLIPLSIVVTVFLAMFGGSTTVISWLAGGAYRESQLAQQITELDKRITNNGYRLDIVAKAASDNAAYMRDHVTMDTAGTDKRDETFQRLKTEMALLRQAIRTYHPQAQVGPAHDD